MADDLLVRIGAEDNLSKGFKAALKSIQQLENELKDFDKALSVATNPSDIIKLNQAIASTQNEVKVLRNLGASSEFAAGGLNKLSKSTSNYNGIGIEFSRIIQDAPFGIIGIGNNITQLAGNFQQLRAQSTSTGAALKTAFASIISPANLLVLSISAITTALTLYSMGAFKSKDATKEAEDALEKYRKTLDNLNKSQIEGASNAQREIQSFVLLKQQAENLNIPLATRLEAVRDLKKEYPTYLGNLSNEQILTGNVGTAYQNLTKEIIATAKARAASDQIAKNSLDVLTLEFQLEEKRTKRLQETAFAQDKINQLIAKRQEQGFLTQGEIQQYDSFVKQLNNAVDLQSEEIPILEELVRIREQDAKLTGLIDKNISSGAKFTETLTTNTKALNTEVKELANTYQSFLDQLGIVTDIDILKRTQLAVNVENQPLIKDFGDLAGLTAPIQEFADTFDQFTEKAKLNISELGSLFASFGSIIGSAFGGAGSRLGQFASQFARFATELILRAKAVSSANVIVGATSAGAASGPAAPFVTPSLIASGLALVATAFRGIGSGGGGLSTSGVGSGTASNFSGRGTSGAFETERIFNLQGAFEISGDKLRYVLNQSEGFRN
jgi:type II secretory pathway pseudopilin PulG